MNRNVNDANSHSRSDPTAHPLLPDDPDTDVDESSTGRPKPIHLRPSFVLLVFAGGTLGAAIREGLSLSFPQIQAIPTTILLINVSGAFLLGFLLELFTRRGPDTGRRRGLRLFLGTGVLGGYTTYSALAGDTAVLLGAGNAGAGIVYALVTVLVGALATWIGIALAAQFFSPQRSRSGVPS